VQVALPVPLDQSFAYRVPAGLEGRVSAGCRVVVPLGPRKLTGVVLGESPSDPGKNTREIIRLIEDQPALSTELLELGRWLADYYCAPIGEVLRTMLPLAGESRKSKLVGLTPEGLQAAARFAASEKPTDPTVQVLRALAKRPLNEAYLKHKLPGAAGVLPSLRKRGWLTVEDVIAERDPARGKASASSVISPSGREVVERRLTKAQTEAVKAIKAAVETCTFRTLLLHGITGSGKTEVYLRAIENVLAAGKSCLFLVPEISLTPAAAAEFYARFGEQVAILHSAFTGVERSGQWRRVRDGSSRVVIGTRSSVFAPVENLGLVIVDEEHDNGYKQNEAPRYHGRDVAIVRARAAGAAVVLGSATPSLESRYNVERGKYDLLRLPERIEQRPLPSVRIVDMRQEFAETGRQDLFSRALDEAIQERLEKEQQVILLLNRRGFSSFVTCRSCGERIECVNCSVTLTHHRRNKKLLCHYCDYSQPVPTACPTCKSEYLYFVGSGSEKVEDHLRERFPKARIARLDRDSVRGRGQYEAILNGFREGAYDILTGTQMVAKGHDMPNVTLAGVVSADIGLGMPDFRAAERTFQILTQVAGRAGRGKTPGEVVLQTWNPEHYAIRYAAAQDYDGFYAKELHFRRMLRYPPFVAAATLTVRSRKLEEALTLSGRLGQHIKDSPGVRVQGPAAAPLAKLKAEFRFLFLLKAQSRQSLAGVLRRAKAFAQENRWPATALATDVDPMSLM
jgi:primosomal protein N' (replication factor Y)